MKSGGGTQSTRANLLRALHLAVLAWLAADLAYMLLTFRQNETAHTLGAIMLAILFVGLGIRGRWRSTLQAHNPRSKGAEPPVSGRRDPGRFAKWLTACALVAPAAIIAATSPLPAWLSVPFVAGLALFCLDVAGDRRVR